MHKNLLYSLIRPIIKILVIVVYHPKIIGKENIPKTGAIIIAGNHQHDHDSPLVVSSTKRNLKFLAKIELFSTWMAPFLKGMGMIPVNRSIKGSGAYQNALKVLKKDGAIVIFPEGTFNKTDDLIIPFKLGAVRMAIEENIPIIPFAITGKYKFFINNLQIEFGKPHYVKSDNIEKENEILMDIVKELISKGRNR